MALHGVFMFYSRSHATVYSMKDTHFVFTCEDCGTIRNSFAFCSRCGEPMCGEEVIVRPRQKRIG
jgi:rRNA maturation endonuclease Nob1